MHHKKWMMLSYATIVLPMEKAISYLNTKGPLFWGVASILTVILLGWIDYSTGYEVSFSLFYLAPIAAASWFAGRRMGLLLSGISAFTWLIAEVASGNRYTNPFINVWNTLIRRAIASKLR
jgi:hypothetical protein